MFLVQKYLWPLFLLFALLMLFVNSRDITLLDCSCPREFHPICGNDHQTYDSACFLECAAKYNRELAKAYDGVCCPSAELCADYFDPVCDQMAHISARNWPIQEDDISSENHKCPLKRNFFENDCIFEFHKCVQRRSSGKLLRIEGRGEEMCLRKRGIVDGISMGQMGERQKGGTDLRNCELVCEEIVAPVCDSQGRTHKNRCKFNLSNCRLRSRGIVSALHIVKEGPCRKEDNNFGQFTNANSMRRMLMANLVEGIRRERTRKKPNLPITMENGENHRRRNEQKMDENGGQSRENLPQSILMRDEQKQQQNGTQRWQLMQWQTESPLPSLPPSKQTQQKQRQHHESSTAHHCPPLSTCPNILDPICDSHNLTHQNECRFSVHRCQFAKNASGIDQPPRIAYRGKCTKISSRSNGPALECDFCKEEQNGPFEQIVPICDNTNLTHQSICLFAQWNCDKRLRQIEEHILGHIGECNLLSPIFELKDEICPSKCSRHFKPVCDSNGITHPNLCTFQMHSCHQRKAVTGRPFGWLISLRECTNQTAKMPSKERQMSTIRSIECPAEPNCGTDEEEDGPICDNQGRLHKNTCLFAHAHCLAAKEGKTLRIEANQQKCAHLTGDNNNNKSIRGKMTNCERKWPNCVNAQPDPYCGSDFITYRNLCAIQRAQCLDNRVEILFKGECEHCLAKPCALPSPTADDSQFVCDQSGETKSRCEFEMLRCIYEAKFGYNITAAYEGKCCPNVEICREKDEEEHLTICDSMGRKHGNRCQFEVAKCRAEKIGKKELVERKCEEAANDQRENEKKTSKIMEAVEAYGGREMVEEEMTTVPPKNVSAELLAVNELICNDRYEPVCGSDGRSYRNGCHLERRNGTKNGNGIIKAVYMGECCPGPEECGPEYSPICDNEGTTHLNFCEFGRQRCLAERSRAHNLTILSYSACPGLHCPTDKCESRYEPVCGTNGKTYANLCELDKSVCIVRSAKMRKRMEEQEDGTTFTLALDYIGECCETATECTNIQGRGQICDNLGRIYADECAFRRMACLKKKRDGQTLRPIQCKMLKHRRRHRRRK